jgi:hypothetical protein
VASPRGIVCFATQGVGSNDESRLTELLADLSPAVFAFDRRHKVGNILRMLRMVYLNRPCMLVMEGTGLAGGAAVLLSRALTRTPYVVSSGDAVGPYIAGVRREALIAGWLYEFMLYRMSAGVISWTPYLAGRALTMGAPRAMTAPGFIHEQDRSGPSASTVRAELGIPADAIVFGLVGSLNWNRRRSYCYGLELIEALHTVERRDIAVLVVGDGTGLERLRMRAGEALGHRVFLPGHVPQKMISSYLAAMDVGSLPQTVDQVGAFRYTAKLSEYCAARLPFITSQIPLAYDLASEWIWRLPGDTPWSSTYVQALADLMTSVSDEEVALRRSSIPASLSTFDPRAQQQRVVAFLTDIIERNQRA